MGTVFGLHPKFDLRRHHFGSSNPISRGTRKRQLAASGHKQVTLPTASLIHKTSNGPQSHPAKMARFSTAIDRLSHQVESPRAPNLLRSLMWARGGKLGIRDSRHIYHARMYSSSNNHLKATLALVTRFVIVCGLTPVNESLSVAKCFEVRLATGVLAPKVPTMCLQEVT